jgi:ABC-2 type transport system ATP-binding protein
MLEARDEGRTVVLSTHNMSQAEALCEYVCIIAGGRKVLDGRVRDLRRAHRGERYSVEFDSRSAAVDRFMETTTLLRSRVRNGPRWEVEPLPGVDARRLLSEVSALDVPLLRFEHVEPSLHEIFVRQVGEAAASEAG